MSSPSAEKEKKKKEKKDKGEKEPSSPKSKDKSDKSDRDSTKGESREKKSKRDRSETRDSASDVSEGSKKDVKRAGQTVYRRSKISVDEGGGKSKTRILWVPEGKTTADKDVVWAEVKDPTGSVIYTLLADSNRRVLELPDIGPTGGGEPEAATAVLLEKKKFPERKEWKEDADKKKVITQVKKAMANVSKAASLTKDEATIMTSNISKEYMSQFKKLDSEGEKWIQQKAETEVAGYLAQKQAAVEAAEQSKLAASSLSQAIKSEDNLPLPRTPLPNPPAPLSPLLTKANFLRDPYYYRRLRVHNNRRTTLESKIEDMVFLSPGTGATKVLCAVPAKVSTPQGDRGTIVCVARDWVGAFALVFVEPPADDVGDAMVTAVYPMLQYVEFPPQGFAGIPVVLDDIPFNMSFSDQQSATYLQDAIKMGFCAMFGDGKDDALITVMRAYSLEFSSMEINYYPGGIVPDVATASRAVLAEENRSGNQMDREFQQLRLCMRTPEGRDGVLRAWSRSVNEGAGTRRKGEAVIANHLRVIEEAVRAPTYHDDSALAAAIVSQLAVLRTDQRDTVKAKVEYLRGMWRIITPIMDQWRSRNESPDVEFPLCFQPAPESEAAHQDAVTLAKRRANYAKDLVPPGIYLTLMCYSGGHVLTDSLGNLFSEVIIPYPSDKELDELTPMHPDFRWILSMAGATDNWSQEMNAWGEVYDNAGRHTFRAQFIRAARQLLQSQAFPVLGFVLDAPIVQRSVSCANILCVLRVESRDRVPSVAGEWTPLSRFEAKAYIQAMAADRNSRISYLPSDYYRCVRFAQAAIDAREALSSRMEPGVYLVHLIYTKQEDGLMILVPERNRFLPPATLVSSDPPTLEQWRWVQGLNERKRRTGSFGVDFNAKLRGLGDRLTFEQRFAKAMADLDQATGVPIGQFYDLDMFVMDESQGVRGICAVQMLSSASQRGNDSAGSGQTTAVLVPGSIVQPVAAFGPALPAGTVPMVWKHCDVVEDSYMRLYWPTVFPPLLAERSAHFRRAFSTAQPFTIDEAYRLLPESSLLHYADVDRYAFAVSFLRQCAAWLLSGGRPLVETYGGSDDTVARSVEDAVDVAVTNLAATTDPNISTMKSILIDAASNPHFNWPTVLSLLREQDKIITGGFAQRLVTGPRPGKDARSHIQRRTFDELFGDEDSDDEGERPATIYNVNCTLEELVFRDPSAESAHRYFEMQEIVSDIIDVACIECIDVGSVKEIGAIVTDMITVIEATDDLLDNTTLLSLKQDIESAAWKEREDFQKHWLEVFRNDSELLENPHRRSTLDPDRRKSEAPSVLDLDDDAVVDEAFEPELFYDGSPYSITSFSDGVRICMAKAANTGYQLSQMLKVANSTSEALELVQALQEYTACVNRRNTLLGNADSSASPLIPGTPIRADSGIAGGGTSTIGQRKPTAEASNAPAVIIVSKEFVEFALQVVDPLRCLALNKVSGKVRFPTIPTSAMEVLANHLQAVDYNVPHGLLQLKFDGQTNEQLLEMALQMKAPILTLWFATELFGTRSGPTTFFSASAALQVRTLVQDGFMFEYGIKDWLHIEVLGGEPIAAAMDVMWWIRYVKEASADTTAADRRDSYSDHESAWKQVYSETRVRVFLSFGVHAVSREEVSLWTQSLGRYVEYLSLRDSSATDAEIQILCSCCPNVKSVDLSYTNISSKSVELLQQHCRGLVECNITGCDLTPQDQDALRRHCAENRRRFGGPDG